MKIDFYQSTREFIERIFRNSIYLIISILILVAAVAYAWIEPTQSPPGGNLNAPLNTGPAGQSKEGGLLLNAGGAANGLLVQGGNVGFGTLAPTTPAPNAQTGNLDVNDIFIRSASKWLSSVNKGGTPYTYYCYSDSGKGTPVCSNAGGTQGYCPAGFKQEMALGDWGFCYMSPGYPYVIYWDLVPGGHCGSGSWTAGNVYGSAYVCSRTSPDVDFLYKSYHTNVACLAAGGEVQGSGSNKFCKFNSSSCPSGWYQYENWSETQSRTCSGTNSGGCALATSCTTGDHGWANQAVDSCIYYNSALQQYCYTGYAERCECQTSCYGEAGCYEWCYCYGYYPTICDSYCAASSANCYANITKIGCY